MVVVAGSVALADSTPATVAAFYISNGTWAAVGDANNLPGPVTAVGVNDGNSSSIFAAGRYGSILSSFIYGFSKYNVIILRSSDGSSPFLYFWNGQSWNSLGKQSMLSELYSA